MKNLLLILLCLTIIFSCKKCEDCTCDSVTDIVYTEEICRDDYDSNEDYNEAIGTLESSGCSCN